MGNTLWDPTSVVSTLRVLCTLQSPSIAGFRLHVAGTFQNVFTFRWLANCKILLLLLLHCTLFAPFRILLLHFFISTRFIPCGIVCLLFLHCMWLTRCSGIFMHKLHSIHKACSPKVEERD